MRARIFHLLMAAFLLVPVNTFSQSNWQITYDKIFKKEIVPPKDSYSNLNIYIPGYNYNYSSKPPKNYPDVKPLLPEQNNTGNSLSFLEDTKTTVMRESYNCICDSKDYEQVTFRANNLYNSYSYIRGKKLKIKMGDQYLVSVEEYDMGNFKGWDIYSVGWNSYENAGKYYINIPYWYLTGKNDDPVSGLTALELYVKEYIEATDPKNIARNQEKSFNDAVKKIRFGSPYYIYRLDCNNPERSQREILNLRKLDHINSPDSGVFFVSIGASDRIWDVYKFYPSWGSRYMSQGTTPKAGFFNWYFIDDAPFLAPFAKPDFNMKKEYPGDMKYFSAIEKRINEEIKNKQKEIEDYRKKGLKPPRIEGPSYFTHDSLKKKTDNHFNIDGKQFDGFIERTENSQTYLGEYSHGRKYRAGVLRYSNGAVFRGEFSEGLSNGGVLMSNGGVLKYPDGSRSVGNNFYLATLSGSGIHITANGDEYYGNFSMDRLEEINAYTEDKWVMDEKFLQNIMIDKKGTIYVGQFKYGIKNGRGLQIYATGDVYAGEFIESLPDGKGAIYTASGQKIEGIFKNGAQDVTGYVYDVKGNGDAGHYIKGVKQSVGEFNLSMSLNPVFTQKTFPNGDVYTGDMKNGLKNGVGIFKKANNGDTYYGYFENDRYNGIGVLKTKEGIVKAGKFKNGTLSDTVRVLIKYADKEIYYGFVRNGTEQKEGLGVYCYKNGDFYMGGFENDKRSDIIGVEVFANGDVYFGKFIDDKMNGTYNSYLDYTKKELYNGDFTNGIRNGNGSITDKTGKKREVKYVNGVLQ